MFFVFIRFSAEQNQPKRTGNANHAYDVHRFTISWTLHERAHRQRSNFLYTFYFPITSKSYIQDKIESWEVICTLLFLSTP